MSKGLDAVWGASFRVLSDFSAQNDASPTGGIVARTLIEFPDLIGRGPNSVPQGSQVQSATLRLHIQNHVGAYANSPNTHSIYQVLTDWDELRARIRELQSLTAYKIDFYDEDELMLSYKGSNKAETLEFIQYMESIMKKLLPERICGECGEWILPAEIASEGLCDRCCGL